MSDYGGMGVSIFSSAAQTYSTAYSNYVNRKAQQRIAEQQQRVRQTMAALALTSVINSAGKVSDEITAEARRIEEQVQKQSVSAMGSAVTAAAASGATGQRVQLAREQQITGAADQYLGRLKTETIQKQDALADQVMNSYKQTVMDLVSAPMDVIPGYNIGGDLLNFTASTIGTVQQYQTSDYQ